MIRCLAILALLTLALPVHAQDSIVDRLAAVERQNAVMTASLNGLSERLDRLEAKLDRLLTGQPAPVQRADVPQTSDVYADDSQSYAARRILFPRLHKLIFPRRGAGGCASGS